MQDQWKELVRKKCSGAIPSQIDVTDLGHGPSWSPIDPVQVSMFCSFSMLLMYSLSSFSLLVLADVGYGYFHTRQVSLYTVLSSSGKHSCRATNPLSYLVIQSYWNFWSDGYINALVDHGNYNNHARKRTLLHIFSMDWLCHNYWILKVQNA